MERLYSNRSSVCDREPVTAGTLAVVSRWCEQTWAARQGMHAAHSYSLPRRPACGLHAVPVRVAAPLVHSRRPAKVVYFSTLSCSSARYHSKGRDRGHCGLSLAVAYVHDMDAHSIFRHSTSANSIRASWFATWQARQRPWCGGQRLYYDTTPTPRYGVFFELHVLPEPQIPPTMAATRISTNTTVVSIQSATYSRSRSKSSGAYAPSSPRSRPCPSADVRPAPLARCAARGHGSHSTARPAARPG